MFWQDQGRKPECKQNAAAAKESRRGPGTSRLNRAAAVPRLQRDYLRLIRAHWRRPKQQVRWSTLQQIATDPTGA